MVGGGEENEKAQFAIDADGNWVIESSIPLSFLPDHKRLSGLLLKDEDLEESWKFPASSLYYE